jgi:hypothetical protein
MSTRQRRLVLLSLLTTALLGASSGSAWGASATVGPTDPRLVPNPVESSDEGTTWSCRVVDGGAQCNGALTVTWDVADGPGDWCAAPLASVDGTFTRRQTRYYQYDAATGEYLEYKRIVHLSSEDSLTPDPGSTNLVEARLTMTWVSTFGTPGDLDSRVTRKQGIDTFFEPSRGGLLLLDVGQKTTVEGEDFDFAGRWDIALGDPDTVFAPVCSALGV